MEGAYRFMNRVWRMAGAWMDAVNTVTAYHGPAADLSDDLKPLFRKIHQTIKKVTTDIEERFHFNTAISAVMELTNAMGGIEDTSDADTRQVMRLGIESVALLLSPIIPHFCEELWERMGYATRIANEPWPAYSEDAIAAEEILVVVQVNGKLRGKFSAPADAGQDQLKEKALACEQAQKFIADKEVKKVIVVPGKLVNIVV